MAFWMLTDSESMRVDRGIINILTKTKPWVKYSAQRPKLAQILRSQKPGWSNLVAALNQQRCQLSKPKDFLIKPYLLWRALVKIRRRFCKNFVFCIIFQIFFCPLLMSEAAWWPSRRHHRDTAELGLGQSEVRFVPSLAFEMYLHQFSALKTVFLIGVLAEIVNLPVLWQKTYTPNKYVDKYLFLI